MIITDYLLHIVSNQVYFSGDVDFDVNVNLPTLNLVFLCGSICPYYSIYNIPIDTGK